MRKQFLNELPRRKHQGILLIKMLFPCFLLFVFLSCGKKSTESSANVPEVTTAEVSAITDNSAQCGGTITSDGGETITARGVCWSTGQTPTISDNKTNDGTGTGSFTSNITGLTEGTTYYVRAYATNSAGTGYGSAMSFTTQQGNGEAVTDIDGNVYQTVTIGTQVWMAENLKVIHYRNGDAIPNVTDSTEWSNLTTGAYCNYDNDANNATTYGRLYNWYAVNDSRNIAPTGWRVPTEDEWTILSVYLGGRTVAGGKLKETGTTHWISPNTGATNETGFTALPGGIRVSSTCIAIGIYGYWWSFHTLMPVHRIMTYDSDNFDDQVCSKWCGISVRCLRN